MYTFHDALDRFTMGRIGILATPAAKYELNGTSVKDAGEAKTKAKILY